MNNTKVSIFLFLSWAIFFSSACRPDETPINGEEPKLEKVWQSDVNDTDPYFGRNTNVHAFNDQIIVTGGINTIVGQDTGTPTIYSFDKNNGQELWTYEITNPDFSDGFDFSFVSGNTFIGFFENGLFAMDLSTRTEKWKIVVDPKVRTAAVPSLFGDRIYKAYSTYGQYEEVVVSHDINTGEEEIHFTNSEIFRTSPVCWNNLEDGQSYKVVVAKATSNQNEPFYASIYNEANEKVYQFDNVPKLGANFGYQRHPIIHNNTLIIQGELICNAYDLINRELLWSYDHGITNISLGNTLPLVIGNSLFLTMAQKDLTCLNIKNGELIWNNKDQGIECSSVLQYDMNKDLLIVSDRYDDHIRILNAFDGTEYFTEEESRGYGYQVIYDNEQDMYFTRTETEVFSFKIN